MNFGGVLSLLSTFGSQTEPIRPLKLCQLSVTVVSLMERSYVQVIWKGQSHTVFPKWTVLYVMILCCLILASGMIPGRLSLVIFNNVPGRKTECNKLHLLFLALAEQGERVRERKTDRHVVLALGCLQVCCGNESIDLNTRLKLPVALWVRCILEIN